MFYTQKSAIGDAAEHFFAYRIAEWFEWPCRLQGVDIGIDAQVELLNNNRQSTGELFAAQVKGRSKFDSQLEITKEHLDYWQKMHIPVFVIQVVVPKQEIYFHQVSAYSGYSGVSGNAGGVYVPFTSGDLLTKSHKSTFEKIMRQRFGPAEKAAEELVELHANFMKIEDIGISADFVHQENGPLVFAKHIATLLSCAAQLKSKSEQKKEYYDEVYNFAKEVIGKIAYLTEKNRGNGLDQETQNFINDPLAVIDSL